MKNIAIIFAGGVGSRMGKTERPKQFLEIEGIPIIIHTLSKFQSCEDIDYISISCVESYIDFMKELVNRFKLEKVRWIVPGGDTSQLSVYNSLAVVEADDAVPSNSIVLIHDGVRPAIDKDLILENIRITKERGNAITVCKATETIFVSKDQQSIYDVLDRSSIFYAKAPQTFILKDIYSVHKAALKCGDTNNIDSCTLMHKYGYKLNFVIGKSSNIKITTYEDYFMYKALYELEKELEKGEINL